MKHLLILILLLPFQAFAEPYPLPDGFLLTVAEKGVPPQMMTHEAFIAIGQVDEYNEKLADLDKRLGDYKRAVREQSHHTPYSTHQERVREVARLEREIEKVQAEKTAKYGAKADELVEKVREKSFRLGELWNDWKKKSHSYALQGKGRPAKPAEFGELMKDFKSDMKKLWVPERFALANPDSSKLKPRINPFHKKGGVRKAAIVAVPLAAAAAVGVAVDADNSAAQASTVQNSDLPAQNNDVRQQQDIEVLDAN